MAISDFIRRNWRHLIYQAVLVGLLVWMAKCSITLADQSNWVKTTGHVGMSGSTSSKGGGSVTVWYKDPETGAEKSASMSVPNSRVRGLVDGGSLRNTGEPAYLTTNIFNTTTVCLESAWEDCRDEARPKWYFLLLVGFLLAVSIWHVARPRS
jgi:hypothetical protein